MESSQASVYQAFLDSRAETVDVSLGEIRTLEFEIADTRQLTRDQVNEFYLQIEGDSDIEAQKKLCRRDLFFLLSRACRRRDIDRDWLFDRCREFEGAPDGYLDLWAREHYKSTIITFGKTIQEIVNDQNITIGIFSHTRPIAKGFLSQIKTELELNAKLKTLFPDILYANPRKESPKWSLDSGIRVKRTDNPKEETVEAWGLVDGQPTSKHFGLLLYDDVVTRESVTTPDQIAKTTAALELSFNLGAAGGRRRFIGTRYHLHDSYATVIDRGTAIPRVHAATRNGELDGEPVFLSAEALAEKRRDQGSYTFSCQMLQNPVADKAMAFKKEWIRYYEKIDWRGWNLYLLVDPASAKKTTSDYTVMKVIGLAPDGNKYLIDAIRDRLNLTQRTEKLFYFHRKYKPKKTGYERYGKDSDIEHIKSEMEHRNYRFEISELGGSMPKADRIKRMVPDFENGKWYLPKMLEFRDYEDRRVDYIAEYLKNEYNAFPVVIHDDMLDCQARIHDIGAEFPEIEMPAPEVEPEYYNGSGGWMG